MRFTSLQWNIGGGFIRRADADPLDPLSYEVESLDSFLEFMAKLNPDIVTIQEGHSNKDSDQIREISQALNLPYFITDTYCESHLVRGLGLNQGIISRFPLSGHTFENFYNPKAKGFSPTGEEWISAEKGVTGCLAAIGGAEVNLKTSHSFPYRRFKLDPLSEAMLPLREDMARKLSPAADKYLYQADLNFDAYSAKELFPALFTAGVQEVILNTPTTPKGRKYDHVLFRGLKHLKSTVFADVLADHFPVLSEFEL